MDCTHHYTHTNSQPHGNNARTITLTCQHCGNTITKITARTDDQIRAELEQQ